MPFCAPRDGSFDVRKAESIFVRAAWSLWGTLPGRKSEVSWSRNAFMGLPGTLAARIGDVPGTEF